MPKYLTLHDGTKILILTKAQRMAQARKRFSETMEGLGISVFDSLSLLNLEKILHRWHELECGIDDGGIERDELTGKVTWYSGATGKRSPFPDRETPALNRLNAIMAKYPNLASYVQGDPRGCALYVYNKAKLAERLAGIDCCYSSIGVAMGIWA